LRLICVASPAYLARHPAPVHPRDLADHACLVTITPSTGSPYRWEFEKGGEALRIAVDGPLVSRDADLRVAAAVAGVGIGFFFEDEVEAPLATGALVQVLADWTPAFPGAYLYYPSRRNPAPPLRAFVDYVREMGRGQILPEG
jgi:DNA-binding transcriptional LysR family regulator